MSFVSSYLANPIFFLKGFQSGCVVLPPITLMNNIYNENFWLYSVFPLTQSKPKV